MAVARHLLFMYKTPKRIASDGMQLLLKFRNYRKIEFRSQHNVFTEVKRKKNKAAHIKERSENLQKEAKILSETLGIERDVRQLLLIRQ